MTQIVTDGFGIISQGITFIVGQPLLLVPVGLAIGGMVIRVVKRNLRG